MIVVSIVPLELQQVVLDDNNSDNRNVTVWKNERYSSPRFCRPLLLEFAKETKEKTLEIQTQVDEQIKQLMDTVLNLSGKKIVVQHTLILSMINGKVSEDCEDVLLLAISLMLVIL